MKVSELKKVVEELEEMGLESVEVIGVIDEGRGWVEFNDGYVSLEEEDGKWVLNVSGENCGWG